jgi:hypothetical protein
LKQLFCAEPGPRPRRRTQSAYRAPGAWAETTALTAFALAIEALDHATAVETMPIAAPVPSATMILDNHTPGGRASRPAGCRGGL